MLEERSGWSSFSIAGQTIGAAVAAKVNLAPGVKKDLVFSLAWDMPRIHTGMGREFYAITQPSTEQAGTLPR